MSLFEQSSIVITPNAYKESKLYSIKPTDGSGDLTVVRATTATRVNSAGLIEDAPYNLLQRSQEFDNVIWTKNAGGTGVIPLITSNTVISPNGSQDADTIVFDRGIGNTISDQSFIQQSISVTASSNTLSIFVKATTINDVGKQIFLRTAGGAGLYPYTLTANWVRIQRTDAIPSTLIQIGIRGGITTGNSVSVDVWGAQLVTDTQPKEYFPTTDRLNVPRLDYTNGSCPSILVEPQRTNLLLRSEEFDNASWIKTNATITANSIIAPSGNLTADKLMEISGGNTPRLLYLFTATIGQNYTLSFYLKSAERNQVRVVFEGNKSVYFNSNTGVVSGIGANTMASMILLNNGWYRCSITISAGLLSSSFYIATAENNVSILSGDNTKGIYIWGAQLEVGAYATSYIPTVASTVTRSADVISRSNIFTNNLITSAGGTWFIELNNNLSLTRDAVGNGIWIGDNNTTSTTGNSLNIRHNGGTARLSINKCIGSSLTGLYGTLTNTVKIAIDWNGTTADVFVNGVKVVTGTAFTTTNMEFLKADGSDVPKYIKSMMLFPKPLTDAEMAQLTTL